MDLIYYSLPVGGALDVFSRAPVAVGVLDAPPTRPPSQYPCSMLCSVYTTRGNYFGGVRAKKRSGNPTSPIENIVYF